MNEAYAINLVQDYIDKKLGEPSSKLDEKTFEYLSCSRWAANEIMDRIIEEASMLPPHITGRFPKSYVEIIEEFIDDMDCAFETCDNKQNRVMFIIARDTGEDILLLFLKGE